MAESSYPLGYQCEFIDAVPDHFYCKKCTLVTRRLTYTTCCGESYCHACIADIQQQGKPCPQCGHENFTSMKLIKHQRQMDSLKVLCSMRARGCDWLGLLGQLDAHLDPDQNQCQHVDVKCPLLCQHTIPRNKVEQHMARECCKREHVCQYCGFRDSYEVVVDTHWPQCIYFPLQCPNFCGVTCERDVMGIHMSMCCLEEVACEFSGVGCGMRFRREEQEEHARQNNQLHLTMTATASMKMDQQLQRKLQEQEEKLWKQEKKLEIQEKKLKEQEEKLVEQKEKLKEQEGKFEEEKQKSEKALQLQEKFEGKLKEQELKICKQLQELYKIIVELQEKSEQNQAAVKEVANFVELKRTFAMEEFSKEKRKNMPGEWMSPAMYTHLSGYKFCIGIDAYGQGFTRGKAMRVGLYVTQGEHDHQLKWPAVASFTIELLHQHGGENIIHTLTKVEWEKPTTCFTYTFYYFSIQHAKLEDILANDTLYFQLKNITVFESIM